MTAPDKAQARLDARVTNAARGVLNTVSEKLPGRGGMVAIKINAERLDDLIIAVKASEALADVTAEGDAS